MQATVTIRQEGDVQILDVTGPLVTGDGADTLRDTVRDLILRRYRQLVVHLGAVSMVDSSGIGELMAARTAVLNRGGQMKLAQLAPCVLRALQVARVLKAFDVFDDVAAAIAGIQPSSKGAAEEKGK